MFASVLLGINQGLCWSTLVIVKIDLAGPARRGLAVGVYRLWRDAGYAVGAVLAGVLADLLGLGWALAGVGALTLASGLGVAIIMYETLPARST